MNISEILVVLKSYPAFDLDKVDGSNIAKQIIPDQNTEQLLQSYAKMYGRIRIFPKKQSGNAYVRNNNAIMEFSGSDSQPLSGISDSHPTYQPQIQSVPSGGGSSELYRIMYEKAEREAREWKDKYDSTLSELRKLEIEHAGNKNSAMGDLMTGLGSVLPAIMNGGGGATALGSAPTQPAPQVQPIQDKRLLGIITYYGRLHEDNKTAIYQLLVRVFQNMDKISDLISLLEDENNG